ncbi:Hypothetical predicted protein [Paramuricea clavata]|uniref:Uncharacterized protein n=1 Tax=Paramuricea clavata TaxID=317549 RepID=A0A6S7GYU5_PARCT|nr:Hypothetical predicted protein [Paramuricea clavata]
MLQKSCNKHIRTTWFYRKYYTVNKQFTVYSGGDGDYFKRNDYWVENGRLTMCEENNRPDSTEYTQKDLLMYNDSIINIKYDDEYEVRTDFSILYKRKRESWLYRKYYPVNKQFTVYFVPGNQYLTRNDYGVRDGKPCMCDEKFRPESTEYIQEDLLMCKDSTINIKYDDEYKVRTDFSILYKNKEYDYTEYRVLNDSIKICNSTDNYVWNIWKVRNEMGKVRNKWVRNKWVRNKW